MKIISILVLLICVGLNAQERTLQLNKTETERATSYNLGYCSDKVFIGVGSGKSDFLKAAIQIPAETAVKFKGNKLTKIKVALGETGFTNPKIFLSYTKEGKAFYSQNVTFTGYNTWDEITLDTPYEIEGKEFYIGYSLISRNATYPIQSDDRPTNPLAGWISLANEWTNISELAKVGNLTILGVIEGDKLPLNDLAFESVYMNHYIKPGETFKIKSQIRNKATETIQSFKVSCQIDEDTSIDTVFSNMNIPYKGVYDFTMNAMTLKEGKQEIKVHISELNGKDDEDVSDNELTDSVNCRPYFMQRKILLEHFTTRDEGSTVLILENLDAAVSVRDNINRVAHFAGYAPDKEFTLPESVSYLWFGGTGANKAMIDRTDLSKYLGPVVSDFTPFIEGTPAFIAQGGAWLWGEECKTFFGRIMNERLKETPALVNVDISKSYDANNRILNMSVSATDLNMGEFGKLGNNLRLNVYLLEDNIRTDQIAPGGGIIYYKHSNVLRKVISETWGDEFTFSGNTFSKEYSCVLPMAWNDKNMRILAFVSNYDKNDRLNCQVYNSETLSVTGNIQSNLSEITQKNISVYSMGPEVTINGNYTKARVYDIMGNLIKEVGADQSSFILNNGIYVIKVDNNPVRKIIISK